MIGRLREWLAPETRAAVEQRGYVDGILSAQLAAASGTGCVRTGGVYQACLNLLGDAASTATLEGAHADVLQPRLGRIIREMVDRGQAAHEMIVGRSGGLDLIPVEITNVQGGAEEESWIYTLSRPGPSAIMTTVREQAGVLNCRLRPSPRSPWRGSPSLQGGEHHRHPPEKDGDSTHLRSGDETGQSPWRGFFPRAEDASHGWNRGSRNRRVPPG